MKSFICAGIVKLCNMRQDIETTQLGAVNLSVFECLYPQTAPGKKLSEPFCMDTDNLQTSFGKIKGLK